MNPKPRKTAMKVALTADWLASKFMHRLAEQYKRDEKRDRRKAFNIPKKQRKCRTALQHSQQMLRERIAKG